MSSPRKRGHSKFATTWRINVALILVAICSDAFPSPSSSSSSLRIRNLDHRFVISSSWSVKSQGNNDNDNDSGSSSKVTMDDDETDNKLFNTINELEETFDYKGRLPRKHQEFRCGFASILGAPNMGKSTLLNALLQEDLCIATRRPQTTRHAILGVVTTSTAQLCLIDTPGIIEDPAYKLQEGMMEAVMGAFRTSDVLVVVTDLFSTPIPDDDIFKKVQQSQVPIIVVINKIDLVGMASPKQDSDDDDNQNDNDNGEMEKTYTVPEAVARWRAMLPNALAIIPLAASEGPDNEGVVVLRKLLLGGDDLPAAIRSLGRPVPGMFRPGVMFLTDEDAKALLPLGPPLYDEEFLTDRPERFFASELIREALFETLKKELPYCCEVQIDEFKEPKKGDQKPINRIKATIYVERDSQKLIVIGKGGAQIKQVGTMAREKIERFLQGKVFLELNVKVNKDWRKDEEQLKQFGYLNR